VVTTASAKSEALPPGSFTNSIGMIFVRLTAGYWVSQTEVTEAQFKKIAGPNESVSALGANYPVHLVSWNEALEFCRKLTAEERQSSWLQKGWAYSLPSEAQWAEFVGNAVLEDSVTSFRTTKRTRPEPVASARPNRFSLFDVRGNVWEWCFSTNQQKMARGGAFNGVTERTLGIEATWPLGPDGRREDIGFRCVMVPER
jgi:formylglycine-generating enzyme required for sulfatase activity